MRTFIVMLCAFVIPFVACSQEDQAETLAKKIAQRLGDTLALSIQERADVLSANLSIVAQKKTVFLNEAMPDSVKAVKLQAIENTRDSLYRRIIGLERFEVYKNKKKSIVNNN